MASNTRQKVLWIFKQLHRTKDIVFAEDAFALEKAKEKIREEFTRHKTVTDAKTIEELVEMAKEADRILKTQVLQLKKSSRISNNFEFRPGQLTEKCSEVNIRCDNCNCGR